MGRIGQPFRGGGELFFSGAKHYAETQTASYFTTVSAKKSIFARLIANAQRFTTAASRTTTSDRTSAINFLFTTIAERIKGHNAPSAVFQQESSKAAFSMAVYRGEAVAERQAPQAAYKASFSQSALGVLRLVADAVDLIWLQNTDFLVDYLEINRSAMYGEQPEGGTTVEDGSATLNEDSTTMAFQDDGVGSYQEGYNRYYGGEFQ